MVSDDVPVVWVVHEIHSREWHRLSGVSVVLLTRNRQFPLPVPALTRHLALSKADGEDKDHGDDD